MVGLSDGPKYFCTLSSSYHRHVSLGYHSQVNQSGMETGNRGRHVKGFLGRKTWCLLAGALLMNGHVVILGNHVYRAEAFEKDKVTGVPSFGLKRTLALRNSAQRARHKN